MGTLRWIRTSAGASAKGLAAGLGTLDSFYLPERRHQLDGLASMSMMAEEDDSGAPPRAVDLSSRTAVIKVRAAAPDSVLSSAVEPGTLREVR
jgi:hypothetical protein